MYITASMSVRAHIYSLPDYTEFTLILLYRDKRRVMERAVTTTLRHAATIRCLLNTFTVQCKVKQGKVIWKTVVVPAPRYSVRVPLIIMVADPSWW